MATVAEMIEFFKTLPQDAIVECGVEQAGSYYNEMTMQPVDIESTDVLDYSSEEYRKKYPSMGGKVVIQLRSE